MSDGFASAQISDGTALADPAGRFWFICEGAKFEVPDRKTVEWLLPATQVRPVEQRVIDAIGNVPADGALLREEPAPIYVIYGGAKFHIPDPWTLQRVYDSARVWNLWPGALDHLPVIPKDGTRLREEDDARVYEIVGGRRRIVVDGEGAAGKLWRNALVRFGAALPDAGRVPSTTKAQINPAESSWDVFISHASQDKDAIVRPLAAELRGRGLRVWYDEYELKIGDSLRARIEQGLASSRRGIVIISPNFFKKHWTQEELNGLTALEAASGHHRLLPVWHNVSHADVARHAPMLADRLAGTTSQPIAELAVQLIEALDADRAIEDRLPIVALSVELAQVTKTTVFLRVRNVASVHAVRVTFEPRQAEGPGVPLTAASPEAILAGESRVIQLERFPPEGRDASALYDLLYTDPAERVLKRQRLRFFLAHDVIAAREYAHLVMERDGTEETFASEALHPWPADARHPVEAWLFRQEWLLTRSTRYVQALRALHERSADP
ncbi:MAG TPA: toll/interleukin-1 receptor domain-containing protein [Solirubrobacteraceae bacterium]